MPRNNPQAASVLLSGGIDSTACVHFYVHQGVRVEPLFVDLGQPARSAEMKSAKAIARFYGLELECMHVRGTKVPRFGEILGRNMMLVSLALMAARASTSIVALGVHEGTQYFDCSPAFITLCEKLLDGYTDGRIKIAAPFMSMNKLAIWKYCKENAVPTKLTWSCEARSDKRCGRCLSCKDREALPC